MASTSDASRQAGAAVPDGPPRENLVRALPSLELVRSTDDTESLTMRGHFAVFNEWAEIDSLVEGHFLERFAPGAFAKTITDNRDRMQVLFDHGLDATIGRKPIGSIAVLEEDETGPYFEVALLPATYVRENVLPGLEAGLFGSSFRFGVVNQKIERRPRRSAHNPNGLAERTITEARVREFGPTPFPVYAGATAGLRSLTDDWFRAQLRDADDLRGHATALITRDVDPDEEERRSRLYARSVELVGSTPWAITPDALATILGVIAERNAGVKLTDEEIRERIGAVQTDAGDDLIDELVGDDTADDPAGDPVAVIRVRGPIVPRASMFSQVSGLASVEQIKADFRSALDDPAVQSILLDIDSPGGSGFLVPELAAEILAARGTKPITAVANARAASAAYWIASAADELVVTPSGDVGSIGVYIAHEDISALQEKTGVKTTLVSAAKYKTEGNPFEPLTEEAKAELQRRVDETYQQFVAAVAKGRGVTPSTVREDFGQGRLVTPSQAMEVGMVDRVATFDETLQRMRKAAGVARSTEPEPPAATTPPEPEPSEATTRAEARTDAGLYLNSRKESDPSWKL